LRHCIVTILLLTAFLSWRFPWYIVYPFSLYPPFVWNGKAKSLQLTLFPKYMCSSDLTFCWLSSTWFSIIFWDLWTKIITASYHGIGRGPCRLLLMRMVHVRVFRPLCISLISSHIWRAWHGWLRRSIPGYFFSDLEGDQELLFYLQKSTTSQFDAQKFFCLFALAHFPEQRNFFMPPKYICIILLEPIPPPQRKLSVVDLLFKITTT